MERKGKGWCKPNQVEVHSKNVQPKFIIFILFFKVPYFIKNLPYDVSHIKTNTNLIQPVIKIILFLLQLS